MSCPICTRKYCDGHDVPKSKPKLVRDAAAANLALTNVTAALRGLSEADQAHVLAGAAALLGVDQRVVEMLKAVR